MGIDGVKTGRTARSGDCLIFMPIVRRKLFARADGNGLSASFDGRASGSANRFGEGTALLQRGWQLYDQWAAGGRVADSKKML